MPAQLHRPACRSFFRCLTVHGTGGLLVESNVGFDVTGHCFYLEVGASARGGRRACADHTWSALPGAALS